MGHGRVPNGDLDQASRDQQSETLQSKKAGRDARGHTQFQRVVAGEFSQTDAAVVSGFNLLPGFVCDRPAHTARRSYRSRLSCTLKSFAYEDHSRLVGVHDSGDDRGGQRIHVGVDDIGSSPGTVARAVFLAHARQHSGRRAC